MKQMMKLLAAVIFFVCLVMLPLQVSGADIVAGGTCGADLDGDWVGDDNLTWTLDTEGTLTVSGTGDMMDWPEWNAYADQIENVILEDGVTSIGAEAFYDCGNLQSVVFGKDVAYIADRAFCRSGLTSLTIPDSVTSVGSSVFSQSALQSVTVGKGLRALGSSMFNNAGALHSVTLSEGLEEIGGSAFANCLALKSITIPNGVTTIGFGAFNTCAYLEEIHLPATVTTIGIRAFNTCISLRNVYFGGSQEQWSSIAINPTGNEILLGITPILGGHTHAYTAGTPVIVASTCTQPGSKTTFCSCGDTKVETLPLAEHTVVIDPAVEATCSANGWTEGSHCGVCGEVLQSQWYINPKGHTPVSHGRTEPGCEEPGLTEWEYCSTCHEVLVAPQQIPALGHAKTVLPYQAPGCTYTGKTEGSACSRCGEVLVVQEDIPALGHKEVVDPAKEPGCTYMGLTEGKHCSVCGNVLVAQEWIPARHKEQTLPSVAPTCTSTGLTAGVKCAECGEVLVAQETVPMAKHDFANGSCVNCGLSYIKASGTAGDGVSWMLDYADTLTISGVGYMKDYDYATLVPWYNYRWSVKKIVVENGITAIGDRAFFECREVEEVTLPASVYSIGEGAFGGCTKLARIFIPANVGQIGNAAFYGCAALQSVELPQRLTSIGARTFMNCTSLTSVTVPSAVTMLDVEAFKGCSALESVYLPDGLQIIGDGAFCECRSLSKADIPETVLYVGRESFKYCEGITQIVVPASVERIGEFAFCGCLGATSATVSGNVTVLKEATFLGCKALKTVTLPATVNQIDRYVFDVTDLQTVYFGGSCAAWKKIEVAGMNQPLLDAYIQCADGHIHAYVDGSCRWCEAVGVEVVQGGEVVYFDTLTEALESGADGYVRLQGDTVENVTVTSTGSLDMNGCSLTGDITVADGAILYLFDSATADYSAENRGKFVGNIDGNVARCFNTPASTGYNYKYLLLQEDDGSWSSHRYYLSVRAAVLVPYAEGYGTAVNYKTVFKCNAVAAQYIAQYGLKLTGDNVIYADYMARGMELLSGGENTNTATTFLQGVLRKENTAAQNAVNALLAPDAQAYIVLSDGTELTSAAVKVSAKELIAAAVEAEELTVAQQRSLARMYMTFRDVLDTWEDVDLETLRSYAQQFGLMQVALLPDDKKIA